MPPFAVRRLIGRAAHLACFAPLAAVALSLAACVSTLGSDFDTRQLRALEPGTVSTDKVQSLLGHTSDLTHITIKHDASGRTLAQPLVADELSYYYLDRSAPAAPGLEKEPRRLASLLFKDGHLISYWTSSTFAADSTDFDPERMRQLRRGLTSQSDVLELLGPPSGRAIHPAALDVNGTRWIYRVQWTAEHQLHTKMLRIDFNAAQTVVDFEYEATTS